jgi:hypothetical protein
MDEAEAGTCPGRSILCVYVRTRTRPGDRARRENSPAVPNHRLGAGFAIAGTARIARQSYTIRSAW